MERNTRPTSIIDTLGEEITRIITPVSICMFLVVILVSFLNSDPSSSSSFSQSITTIANLAYDESSSDSFWDKFEGALLNSLVFVVVVTVITFFLVFLFYIRCTKFLKFYMGFSAFVVLAFMGGQLALMLVDKMNLPIDAVTFLVVLFNFAIVGVLAVFISKMAILVTQSYLVVIGMLVAFWFTMLPEWTTWVLLVAMALYDLAAVLLPVGPLRLLVELAMSRDEDIPALVYEARPVNVDESAGVSQRRLWRGRRGDGDQNASPNNRVNLEQNPSSPLVLTVGSGQSERDLVDAEEGQSPNNNRELSEPLLEQRMNGVRDETSNNRLNLEQNPRSHLVSTVESGQSERDLVDAEEGRMPNNGREIAEPLLEQRMNAEPPVQEIAIAEDRMALEGIGLGSSGAIKLGLGDFIFYSVLVGRAAMYDFMTVYACYLAIIAGLGITLMLLAIYQKALPALPVSIMLGVLFYVLTRTLLEEFIVQCSMNFLMF